MQAAVEILAESKSMIRIFASACAAACLWSTAAFCQATSSPKANTEPSAYCRSAAQALFEGSGAAEVATVWQRCKQNYGDTHSIALWRTR
jgi:hypothetical protein